MTTWLRVAGLAASAFTAMPAAAEPIAVHRAAQMFGARPDLLGAALSPDGKRIAMIGTAKTRARVVYVVDVSGGVPKPISYSDDAMRITSCGWSSNDRILCTFTGSDQSVGFRLGFRRLVAMDADGKNMKDLSARSLGETLRISQDSGAIVDWLDGGKPDVLLMRDHVPAATTGARTASTADGFGVDRVDTRTLKSTVIERASPNAEAYITDGQGRVRIMEMAERDNGMLRGTSLYRYRMAGDTAWRPFSRVNWQGRNEGLRPLAVDGPADVAYALRPLNGREALYRVKLDGSLAADLVQADRTVDVDDVVTIGRRGRVIGVTYVTDRRVIDYFDPEYRALAVRLSKALPRLPLVTFESASADESVLLLRASSDTDGGRFFVYEKASHRLSEVLPVRAALEGVTTATVKSITYPAGDGTSVPAYLTLPPGSTGKGLAAIVMPHGGPAARDEWGFDWLAQFFAARGFAVIQPQFRGSSGFGDAWYTDNGFKSWRIAIRDVTAAGHYLVANGIVDPARLAIVGWSYGGYAALQSNVLEPDLFKAVVAIAPVTDLRLLKVESAGYINARLVNAFIGEGPHLTEGSPALHADRFRAPVLMFHGDADLNVRIGESEAMDAALRRAGRKSELVRYPGLDHQLEDNAARMDMLTRADAFLTDALHL